MSRHRPTRRTIAAVVLGAGISAGSAGLSLLLWGGGATPPATVAQLGSLPPPGAVGAPVAAAAPVGIDLPTIHVSSALQRLQIQADGTLQVPTDPGQAGWWSQGARPGASGPAIIVGHVDSRTGPAVFYRLADLRPGDRVLIHRADGSTVAFLVDALRRYPKNAFPTDVVYGSTPDPTLRLLTCTGTFDRSSGHYEDNLVVFAHLAAAAGGATAGAPVPGPAADRAGGAAADRQLSDLPPRPSPAR